MPKIGPTNTVPNEGQNARDMLFITFPRCPECDSVALHGYKTIRSEDRMATAATSYAESAVSVSSQFQSSFPQPGKLPNPSVMISRKESTMKNLVSLGYAAGIYQRAPQTIAAALRLYQSEPVQTVNGIDYYSADDVEQAMLLQNAAEHHCEKNEVTSLIDQLKAAQ